MKEMKVKLTFTEEILGTSPNDKEVYKNFIASKAPDASTIEEEVAAIGTDEVVEKGKTVFPRMEDGTPFVYDYQIKGFFKDSCGMLARVKGTKSSSIKAYKKVIDGLIFPSPRKIPINLSGDIGLCQRPLRGNGPQGERVALAISETAPEGSSIEFSVKLFDEKHEDLVLEWLSYGCMRGTGQWRNSGKGKFTYEILQ